MRLCRSRAQSLPAHKRGTHGSGWKHTPLGTDPPPKDWPHPPPTEPEILQALKTTAEFVAGMETDE